MWVKYQLELRTIKTEKSERTFNRNKKKVLLRIEAGHFLFKKIRLSEKLKDR